MLPFMADAAFQIQNGFEHTFPHVVGLENFILMCWFHVMKAIQKFKFECVDNKEQIKNDIRTLHKCANVIVFRHAVKLFLLQWSEKEPKFYDYFRSEWVQKHPNWFCAANLKVPNTNNLVEGTNATFKKNHTLRRRQPLTMFKETLVKMLSHISQMYVREREKKIFHESPQIETAAWKRAVEYAKDSKTKQKVFKHGAEYYILSNLELECQRVNDGETAANLFNNVSAEDFNDYQRNYHQRVYQLTYGKTWHSSTCSCPYYMDNPTCKHILALALLKRDTVCPSEANTEILGKKPKRGPKSKAKNALYKPK